MRAGDRRGVKIVRAHAHGAVTHLRGAGDVARTRRGETSALAPASPDADVAETYLVTGGSDGNVRFFDVELRLVAWFGGLGAGRGHERLVRRDRAVANVEANDARDARDEPTKNAQLEKRPTTFAAPDFVVATNDSFVFASFRETSMRSGRTKPSRAASLVSRGATEPAVALAAHPTDPVLCVAAGLHGGVWTWNYATHSVVTHVDLTRGGVKPQSKPTCVAYRTDGLASSWERAAASSRRSTRRRWRRRRRCGSRPTRSRACAAATTRRARTRRRRTKPGRLAVPPARAYPRAAGRRTRAPSTSWASTGRTPRRRPAWASPSSPRPTASPSAGVRWRAEGRVARYDVEGSTAEDGVDVLEVSDVALGGEWAAGGPPYPPPRRLCKKTRHAKKKDARVELIESVARRFAVASVADVGRRLRVRLRLRVRVGLGRAARTHAAGRGRPPEAAPGGLRDADVRRGEVRPPYGGRASDAPGALRGKERLLRVRVRARRRRRRAPSRGRRPRQVDGRRRAPRAGAGARRVRGGGRRRRRRGDNALLAGFGARVCGSSPAAAASATATATTAGPSSRCGASTPRRRGSSATTRLR